MEHFNKRQMKIYIHARFTWGLHRRLLTCGMRGISGNNILQIVSFHLFTTNLPHTSISLILKIPRYFKVIKGQILKYHAENCRRIRIQQHMGLQTSCYKSVHNSQANDNTALVFALHVPSCCIKFGTSCWQPVTNLVALSDLQGYQTYKTDQLESLCSDQLESLCSFDHYAPSLYQINLKLLIQNIIICKILYTFSLFCK
jgi:hypothetical protein